VENRDMHPATNVTGMTMTGRFEHAGVGRCVGGIWWETLRERSDLEDKEIDYMILL
jgi:hypothetical protein